MARDRSTQRQGLDGRPDDRLLTQAPSGGMPDARVDVITAHEQAAFRAIERAEQLEHSDRLDRWVQGAHEDYTRRR